MQEAHTSSEFDQLLERARLLISQMGARVERQLDDAIECVGSGSTLLIDQVLRHESEINQLERSIDALAGQIIARRKPAAGDLRLVLAITRAPPTWSASPMRRRRSRCAPAASPKTAGRAAPARPR
jgi:phosphate transport system protein